MSESKFDFSTFVSGSINSLANPRGFFAEMKTSGGFLEPIIKALIYGILAAIINYIWILAGFSVVGSGIFGAAVGSMVFIGTIFGFLIGLFIGGLILLIFSAICSGDTDYEANVRVTASLMVLAPVNALFNFVFAISPVLATIIGLLINAFGLWMLYNALVQTLKAKEESAKVLVLVLLIIMVLFTLIGLFTGAVLSAADAYQ